ncbi:hypothetical protein AAY473_024521 [Plecturocebus cupreus]
MLPKLVSDSWVQAIHLPWPPKVLGLQALATAPDFSIDLKNFPKEFPVSSVDIHKLNFYVQIPKTSNIMKMRDAAKYIRRVRR